MRRWLLGVGCSLFVLLGSASAQPTPVPTEAALTVNNPTGAITAPISAATFITANGLGTSAAVDGYFADPSTNGSFSASAWRSDLGLVIGTNVQAYDAALQALAGGSDFVTFSGPSSTTKTFALPNASATILTDNAAVTVAQGGTGRATSTTAYGLLAAGTTATGAQQTLAAGATTEILVGGGASALPAWTAATGSGSPVRATSPTLVTPALGTPSAVVLTNATGTAASLTVGTATALATSRMIGGANFNGTADVTSFPAPGAIGATTPSTGAFTTVSATSNVTISGSTADRYLFLDTSAGQERGSRFRTAGIDRWVLYASNVAESGANAGSNFGLNAYSDAGSYIDTPISIPRIAGGTFTTTRPVAVTATTVSTSTTTWAIVVAGGIGAAGNINAGGNMVAAGNMSTVGTTADLYHTVSASAGQERAFRWQTAGVTRWLAFASNTSESGANAGSNFGLNAYSDAGSYIDTPISIPRIAGGTFTTSRPFAAPSATLTGTITTPRLNKTQATLTYAGTTNIDFNAVSETVTLALTGNVTFTTSNLGAGKSMQIIITSDASIRTFTFPGSWIFLGASAPASIAASKTGVLSLYSSTSADSGVIASWSVQP